MERDMHEGAKQMGRVGQQGVDYGLNQRSTILDQDVKPMRDSGVLIESERLGKAISELEQTLAQFLSRVGPVIRDVPPQVESSGHTSAPEPALSHVGAIIRDERRRLEIMTALLREVSRRVDL